MTKRQSTCNYSCCCGVCDTSADRNHLGKMHLKCLDTGTGSIGPVFSAIKLFPRYKRMVSWKLVEPLLTPHRRYPDKMTSPFVWKSIASTRSLPLEFVEYPQDPSPPELLDPLRQHSQVFNTVGKKKNDLWLILFGIYIFF